MCPYQTLTSCSQALVISTWFFSSWAQKEIRRRRGKERIHFSLLEEGTNRENMSIRDVFERELLLMCLLYIIGNYVAHFLKVVRWNKHFWKHGNVIFHFQWQSLDNGFLIASIRRKNWKRPERHCVSLSAIYSAFVSPLFANFLSVELGK